MSSKNAPFIKAYATAIANGLSPGQESDLANRIADDLDAVYTALFTGPLPVNSAVNLTDISRTSLPPKIAWTDLVNLFEKNQEIDLTYGAWISRATGGTKPSRFQNTLDGGTLVGSGISFDGTGYHTDGGDNSGMQFNNGYAAEIVAYVGGVLKHLFRVESAGQVTIGQLATLTGLVIGELGIGNSLAFRGTNAAGNANLPLVFIDVNNLVQLGSNNATGDGAIAIPKNTAVNLPASGATRNGIIALDTTNNRLCYWVNGNRYFIPIGTIF